MIERITLEIPPVLRQENLMIAKLIGKAEDGG
jgi:hypothetical protein